MLKLLEERTLAKIVVYSLLFVWGLIYLVPTRLQKVESNDSPLGWWSNFASIGILFVFILVFLGSIFSQKIFSKSKWASEIVANPWLWSSALFIWVFLNFTLNPNLLGVNFGANLVVLAFGLPLILNSAKFSGDTIRNVLLFIFAGGVLLNWLYQLAVNTSYSQGSDVEFAHSLALLCVAWMSTLGRSRNLWGIAFVHALSFGCFFFLAGTQLRAPALIAGTLFAVQGLWQTGPWFTRLFAVFFNSLLALMTWLSVSVRPLLIDDALYTSGRPRLYEPILSADRKSTEIFFGRGPGSARQTLFEAIGYGNPHSSLLVVANDYGVVGVGLLLGLVISIVHQVKKSGTQAKIRSRAFFATIALLLSFSALSLYAEPVESTAVALSALVAFLFISLDLNPEATSTKKN